MILMNMSEGKLVVVVELGVEAQGGLHHGSIVWRYMRLGI
jgi:hypothetical protein